MPSQIAKTTYTLPRLGTTTGVSGTELFGEEWSHQLVSQCLLPQDVAHALEAPLRQPLSASIGRRTTLIPGKKLFFFPVEASHARFNAGVLSPIAKALLGKPVLYVDFLCVVAMATLRWYGLHR